MTRMTGPDCAVMLLLLLFLTFSALAANPKKLLYTVANPARGLPNREKKKKKKVWQRPPPARAARSQKKKKKKSRDASTRLGAMKVGVRPCLNVLIESVQKICRQNLSKIKLCDWPNNLDTTS